jgi:hypothetical protein
MLHCLAADACGTMCEVSAAVELCVRCQPPCRASKHLRASQKKHRSHAKKFPLAPLAFWSQRGDSGGLLANARPAPRICSSPTRVPLAATRNLRGICPKQYFFHPKFGPSVEHWRGTESTENSTKSDGIEQATADRKAPFGPQNAQSRKGMSAPGNSCRPQALPRNSAQERYTSPRLCTRATPSSRWALARNVPRVTRERADVISLRVRRYRTVGLPRCVPARLDTGGHKGLTGV